VLDFTRTAAGDMTRANRDEQGVPSPAMTCPECHDRLVWIPLNEDPDGGWWQCSDEHRYRRSGNQLVPLQD